MEQSYSDPAERCHVRWLLPLLADSRCIRANDCPPASDLYRPAHLPNPKRAVETLRNECVNAGLPDPFLLGLDAHSAGTGCRQLPFDGTVGFESQLGGFPRAAENEPSLGRLWRNLKLGVFGRQSKVCDYTEARRLMNRAKYDRPFFPSVCVGWDNTSRLGNKGVIMINNTPDAFAKGVQEAAELMQSRSNEERLVFINAWNEWAEGNHLKPDHRSGLAYLKALRCVVMGRREQ